MGHTDAVDRRRWLLLRGGPLLVLLGSSLLVLYGNWVAQEPSVAAPQGDAVIVHAGHVDRVRHAVELMEDGAAPTLVVMLGRESPASADLCDRTAPYEVVCPSPPLRTTIGEARELARLADARDWSSVVAVTSDYHLRRATYLDAKCTGIDVVASGSGQRIGRAEALLRIAKEMAAMVQAAAVRC